MVIAESQRHENKQKCTRGKETNDVKGQMSEMPDTCANHFLNRLGARPPRSCGPGPAPKPTGLLRLVVRRRFFGQQRRENQDRSRRRPR